MRRCVGCMKSFDKSTLIRIAYQGGSLVLDTDGKSEGRGCYICKDSFECIEKAFGKKGLNRAFKRGFDKAELEALKNRINEIR